MRVGVVPSCANPTYTPFELVHQLKLSKSKFILTHPLMLKNAIEAAKQVGMPASNVFLISKAEGSNLVAVPELVELGKSAPEIVPMKLAPGQNKTKVALINFSSGTSGLPKGVAISHYNVIANVCQMYEGEGPSLGTVANGCLPFFHSMSTSQCN